MSRRSLVGDVGLLRRLFASGFRASLLVAVLVGVAVAGVAVAPRALARLGDRELQHALATTTTTQLDLAGTGHPSGSAFAPGIEGPYAYIDLVIRNVRLQLPQPLQGLVGAPHWMIRSPAQTVTLPRDQDLTLILRLGIDLRWEPFVRPVDGELPAAYDGHG